MNALADSDVLAVVRDRAAAVGARVRGAVADAPAAARAMLAGSVGMLAQPMTRGQRQSAVLLVPLTLALVLYGRPAERADAPALPVPAPAGAPDAFTSELAGPAPVDPDGTVAPDAPAVPDGGLAIAPARTQPGSTAAAAEPSTGSARTTNARVVAVVRPSDGGPGDEDFADAFLTARGVDATLVPLEADRDVCGDVLARGSLVLGGVGLGPSLRECLVAGGATVVAFDALGDLPPGEAGPGQVLSTRRAIVDGLVEAAARERAAGRLDGPTGIVTVESARAQVDAAVTRLEALGVDVAVVTSLPDEGSPVATSQGVLEFAGAGVTDTVFVAPVEHQREWVAQSSVLSPSMRYVVTDAFGAVLDADYPDGFDTARTWTTLEFGWQLEPTPARLECDTTWTGAGGGDRSVAERLRMYAWCQHVSLAALTGAGGEGGAGLRTLSIDSPLTSPLGPVGDDGWGPTRDRGLRWQAGCGCWVPDGAPNERITPRS